MGNSRFAKYSKTFEGRHGINTSLVAMVFGVAAAFFHLLTLGTGDEPAWVLPVVGVIVAIGAGVCGPRHGLITFFIVFFAFLISRYGDVNSIYPTFMYIILILASGHMARLRWYKSAAKTIIAFIILGLTFGTCYYMFKVYITGDVAMELWQAYCLRCSSS